MIHSDNEDYPASADYSLHHSSSTFSLSALAPSGSIGGGTSHSYSHSHSHSYSHTHIPDRPVRQRSTSTASNNSHTHSNSNYIHHSNSHSADGHSSLNPVQLQYIDVLGVNNPVNTAEVCVPDVKQAPLFSTINAIHLLEDAQPHRATKQHKELVQRLVADKKTNGYDCPVSILPPKARAVNEVYIDYDADSEDERFVADLNTKLHQCGVKTSKKTSPKLTPKVLSKATNNSNSSSVVSAADGSHASNNSSGGTVGVGAQLKVRCVELMLARLEREFELARLFSSKYSGTTSLPNANARFYYFIYIVNANYCTFHFYFSFVHCLIYF